MRRLCAWLLAVATLVLLLVSGPAAQAIDINPFNDGCTPRLIVGTPASGPANGIDGGPENPRDGDPFKKDPKVSAYEVYGYGGLSWPSFSCSIKDDALGAASDPGGSALGALASGALSLLTLAVATCAAIVRFAFDPSSLAIFNPIMRLAAQALGDSVFRALFWITLVVTGIVVVWQSHRNRFRESVSSLGWVMLAGMIGVVATAYPLVVAPKIDSVLTGVISNVNTQLAGASGSTALSASDGMAGNLHHGLLYQTWCSGMVGRDAGETATEYCPRFFKASSLTRAEFEKVQKADDPSQAMNDLVQKKGEDFKAAADDLEKADPVAYSFLTGNHNSERLGYAALGWFGFICAVPFMLVAALLLLFALVVVRLAIMVLPAVVVVGGFPSMRRFVTQVFDYTAGALITALVFGSLSAVFVAMVGAFMSPTTGVHPLLSMVLLLITTIAAWKFSKPYRRVKNLTNIRARIPRAGAPTGEPRLNPENYEPGPQKAAGAGGIFTPASQPTVWQDSTPAEAKPSMFKAAAVGAMQGAATTAALGLVSGGTITAAGMAAGAARGAGGAAVASGMAGRHRARTEIDSAPVGARSQAPAAPRTPPGLPPGTTPPKRARTTPSDAQPRVYRPGERNPAENMRITEPTTTTQGERVYALYTPASKGE